MQGRDSTSCCCPRRWRGAAAGPLLASPGSGGEAAAAGLLLAPLPLLMFKQALVAPLEGGTPSAEEGWAPASLTSASPSVLVLLVLMLQQENAFAAGTGEVLGCSGDAVPHSALSWLVELLIPQEKGGCGEMMLQTSQ